MKVRAAPDNPISLPHRMTSLRFRVVLLLAWLASVGWLVRYEAFPGWFNQVSSGYRQIFAGGEFVSDTWMQILYEGRPIGYSHTWVDRAPEDRAEAYVVRNLTHVQMKIMERVQKINMQTTVVLDADCRLQRFAFLMPSGTYSVGIEGRRVSGKRFKVNLKTPSGAREEHVDIPDDAVLYSPMTEIAVAGLRPGQQMRVRTLEPITLTASDVLFEGVRRESYVFEGTTQEVSVIKVTFQGMDMLTWVDAGGRALRQETSLGWVMEARSQERIEMMRLGAGSDMIQSLAVPCAGTIAAPRSAQSLRVRMTLSTSTWDRVETPRQAIEQETGGGREYVLLLRAQQPPGSNAVAGADLAPYLRASSFIQSDHPSMIKQAKAIAAGATGAWAQARAIGKWVHENVRKQPAASLPSALDVLTFRSGDCNEHTYLFVGLARAAGIPARIHVGLAYNEGMFYYHAWPAVHVGEWVEMDPTFGQDCADATHITLLTGELASQMQLGRLLGRLKITVLEER